MSSTGSQKKCPSYCYQFVRVAHVFYPFAGSLAIRMVEHELAVLVLTLN